jgi:hypothetical protein
MIAAYLLSFDLSSTPSSPERTITMTNLIERNLLLILIIAMSIVTGVTIASVVKASAEVIERTFPN